MDNQTNFMVEVSNIAAQNVDGLKLGEAIRSSCGNYIYHISIIDYLQKSTFDQSANDLFKSKNMYFDKIRNRSFDETFPELIDVLTD